jgi:beta-aspartyl-peptidase (threonine type)
MERSPHVMLASTGAEEFALEQGLAPVPNSHFATERRRLELEQTLRGELPQGIESLTGTVGAVALDSEGNLAAATSTGGTTGKRWGRVGDSPIIGAGTYAANDCCAVSATGHGEFFIRAVVAHEIAALIRYRGLGVQQAADEVVLGQLTRMGGSGGVIAIGRDGPGAQVPAVHQRGVELVLAASREHRSATGVEERVVLELTDRRDHRVQRRAAGVQDREAGDQR